MNKALLMLLGVVVGVLLGLVAESLLEERVEPLPNVEPDWGGWGW